MSVTDAAEVYLQYNSAENAHDLDLLESLVAPGLVVEVNGRVGVSSADEDREAMRRLFETYPDYRRSIEDVLEAGDRVTVRWRMLGTPAAAGAAALDVPGCSVVTAREGQLAEAYLYYDGEALDRILAGIGD